MIVNLDDSLFSAIQCSLGIENWATGIKPEQQHSVMNAQIQYQPKLIRIDFRLWIADQIGVLRGSGLRIVSILPNAE